MAKSAQVEQTETIEKMRFLKKNSLATIFFFFLQLFSFVTSEYWN